MGFWEDVSDEARLHLFTGDVASGQDGKLAVKPTASGRSRGERAAVMRASLCVEAERMPPASILYAGLHSSRQLLTVDKNRLTFV
jgi:hypothetical protein